MRLLIALLLALIGIKSNAQTNLQHMIEERDLLARMSVICTPDFWVNSNGVLYLQPKTYDAELAIKAFNPARSQYQTLTNKTERGALVSKYIDAAGVGEDFGKMILHPKILSVGFHRIETYKMIQSMENGDALIQPEGEDVFYYVYGIGRAPDDQSYGNAQLIRDTENEGLKTYTTTVGGTKTVRSYRNVALTREDKAALKSLSNSFSSRVRELSYQINIAKSAEPKTTSAMRN